MEIIFPNSSLDALLYNIQGALPSHISTHYIKIANVEKEIKVTSLADYGDHNVSTLIWGLKYLGDAEVVAVLADALSSYLIEEVAELLSVYPGREVIIVPVPLSKQRKKYRGFNQLELVLDKVKTINSELSKFINYSTLQKHKDTKPQTHLTKKERLKNIKGVFSLKDIEVLKGVHVILIDDVLTTGATVTEVSRLMLKQGISGIEIVTISRRL